MVDSLTELRKRIEITGEQLALKRAELRRLERELETFAKSYDRVVGALEAKLDELTEKLRETDSSTQSGNFWGGYRSFEESFDAKYRQPLRPGGNGLPGTPTYQGKRQVDEETLRSLYRRLVRQYHPDTVRTPEDKARYTVIMAQINTAWRARDADALYAIDSGRLGKVLPMPDMSILDRITPTFYELNRELTRLEGELTDTQIAIRTLQESPLMRLKFEESLARARGVNLLGEIATRLRAEISTFQTELARRRS
jgi:hypothetical protein